MAMNMRPRVLVVAGSDSSGGAGIARDIATLAHFGVGASLAVTAITAQTHGGVVAVEPVSARLVAAQMRAALAADPIGAIKIGMMATAETVEAISETLAAHPSVPVVLDPVIASTSGARLLSAPGVEHLKQVLLPATHLVTPNLPELAALSGRDQTERNEEVARQAAILLALGCGNVLVKGGHAHGPQSIDTLYVRGEPPRTFIGERRHAVLRGTGCMLASAIAANLTMGQDTIAALAAAKAYMADGFSIAAGGEGQRGGPPAAPGPGQTT